MVKVASFGNLGNIRNVSSLSDLHHAGTPGKNIENSERFAGSTAMLNGDNPKVTGNDNKDNTWADMSLLVISNISKGGE